jgi:hypothetical protein
MVKVAVEEFPYNDFPWRLKYTDGKDKRTCFFQSEDHMKKHIEKYKLKKKEINVGYKFSTENK